ncbi:MAG: type III-A CRISPR-associated protein Cas10/Csm1 [Deltaproteobacteria bacterium]|nr:type III-A CRISPR-associated protein Cas10/Csm1 [Deltaproteobacteria bacterium]
MELANKGELVLGALLHDIGKFFQRTGLKVPGRAAERENELCPTYKGRYSHRHSLYTAAFFDSNILPVPEVIRIDQVARVAENHHRPEAPDEWIIAEADRLSSGMDRLERDSEDEIGQQNYRKERLNSIFEGIFPKTKTGNWKHDLSRLSLDKALLFPKPINKLEPAHGSFLDDKYADLWQEFCNELPALPIKNESVYLSSLLSLLEQYTWCIPSSTMDIPDISLYDHTRTTAAIAACLYDYHSAAGTLNEGAIKDRVEKKFIMAVGDLSGIQKYLFDFSIENSKGISKILRARSFYIGALLGVAVHKVLRALDLPLVCSVMNAGGRAFMLLPNTDQVKNKLVHLVADIDAYFLREFRGELTLNFAHNVELRGNDFKSSTGGFKKVLEQLDFASENCKRRKLFVGLCTEAGWDTPSFVVNESFEKGSCTVCGKQPGTQLFKEDDVEAIEQKFICIACQKQIDLGGMLVKTNYLVYSESDGGKGNLSFFDNSYTINLLEDKPKNLKEAYLVESIDDYTEGCVRTFLANHVPREGKRIKTFEELASPRPAKAEGPSSGGKAMLGVLKADIDSLGLLISEGLGEKVSVSRYATMSRMLNLFFTGYLQSLMKGDSRFNDIYTVYAGGDDLFVLSHWETIIEFSKQMRDDLSEYACGNSKISISAGIALAGPKAPISRFAEEAEEYLEEAKNVTGKNALHLFNTTVKWGEFPDLCKYYAFLNERVCNDDSEISASFLYRLLQYHNMFMRVEEQKDIEAMKFHSLMSYDIARNIRKGDAENPSNINELTELYRLFEIGKMDASLMRNLKIPLFWAMYKNRT